eukprot:COSAG02_NODE_2650_length_8327_cov_247.925620_1_plen_867_part_00
MGAGGTKESLPVVLLSFGAACAVWALSASTTVSAELLVGVGKADVTGIIAQSTMVGFADPEQIAAGLHTRLWARAFVALDDSDPLENRVAFVSADIGMPAQAVRLEVARRLGEVYTDGRYSARNVGFSVTHAHAGPAGYFQYMLFDTMSMGFINQTFEAITGGIVQAIVQAEGSLAPGTLSLGRADVSDGGYNRSPTSYLLNPHAERSMYATDHDDEMTLLRLAHRGSGDVNTDIGMFSWFAVHPTNMNRSNTLVSADNKGLASWQFERWATSRRPHQNMPPFVAAFAQGNQGDISPNVGEFEPGALCVGGPNEGLPCEPFSSTCQDELGVPSVELCIARGPAPGGEIFGSTRIIAERQFLAARQAWNTAVELPQPSRFGYVHQFVDMESVVVPGVGRTCRAAMGYSFAAGTTDGPGTALIASRGQGMTEGTPLWDLIRDILIVLLSTSPPTAEDYACHAPKPVLLPTGFMDIPYAWHPSIIDVQMLRIGELVLLMAPSEFTTMAGRRLRRAVADALRANGMAAPQVVIAGVSNVYTHYVVTPEEYEAQRYEAASTLYGKHTLAAYIMKFTELVPALLDGSAVDPGPDPPNLLPDSWATLQPPPPDTLPAGAFFGQVIDQPQPEYIIKDDNSSSAMPMFASASFWGANPRHNMRLGGSFLRVERSTFVASNGSIVSWNASTRPTASLEWSQVANDDDDMTRLKWSLVDSQTGTRDRAPSAGFKRKHELFMAMMFESVEVVTGRRIDLIAAERCAKHGGGVRVGPLKDIWNASMHGKCRLDDVAPSLAKTSKGANGDDTNVVQTSQSVVDIVWELNESTPSGEYRLVYTGDHLMTQGEDPVAFEGVSRPFVVVNCVLDPELSQCSEQ